MRIAKRTAALILSLALLLTMTGTAFASGTTIFGISAAVNGEDTGMKLRVFEADTKGNVYASLSSLSAVLKNSDKKFVMELSKSENDGDVFVITTGKAAVAKEPPDNAPTSVGTSESFKNRIFLDGKERKYGTYRAGSDLFMNLTDIQLMLDITLSFTEDGGIDIHTDEPFRPDIEELNASGYFSYTNGVLLGDADTGEILFSFSRLRPAPIASITKLMTYLMVAEAEQRGEISFEDKITVSPDAAALSQSPSEGIIWLSAGLEIPMSEVLQALLIASSNESAVMLAEHVCGSVDAFVKRMNERAEELGLHSAKFYNPNGLPTYSGNAVSGKIQNVMNAVDVFNLSRYILENFPEITDLTSQLLCNLPTMETNFYNSNHPLFNVPGVIGLKTGYTNRAGSCVVDVLPVTADGETHNIIVVVLGTETTAERNRISEILLSYGRDYYKANGFRN